MVDLFPRQKTKGLDSFALLLLNFNYLSELNYIQASSKSSSTFGHTNAIANLNHYSFLKKLIPYTVYKYRKIYICMTKYRAGFATDTGLFFDTLPLYNSDLFNFPVAVRYHIVANGIPSSYCTSS